MTVPHLMNCPHIDDGWCLDCVAELGNENWRLRAEVADLRAECVGLRVNEANLLDAQAENDKLRAGLKHIAAIAYSGGLAGFDDFDAMCAVRRLTRRHWEHKKTRDDQLLAAVDAVRASERPAT